ncbi:MAG TPA: response regulator [Allocoleopsis sp.]
MSKPVILCVDDEVFILETLERQLKRAFKNNYIYEFAESGDEALEIIEELHQKNVDIIVIVSDWLMPGLRGDEFLMTVHRNFPNTIKIILTGQADDAAIERVKQQVNLYSFLQKPWENDELIEVIKSGLATQ